MKRCPACKLELDAAEFHKDSSRPSGLQTYCKRCYGLLRKQRWPSSKPKPNSPWAVNR